MDRSRGKLKNRVTIKTFFILNKDVVLFPFYLEISQHSVIGCCTLEKRKKKLI